MKRFLLAAMAALWVTLLAGTAAAVPPPADTTRSTSAQPKGVELSGRLSSDGRLLVAEDDNTWAVANAESLKGLESRFVKVVCRMDPQHRTIKVLFVVEPAPARGAHMGDAAFRR